MKKLSQAYFSPNRPSAYGGVQPLKKAVKLRKEVVQDWLSNQDAYTLHKPVRKNFARRRTIVGGIDQQWQADLIDLQKLKKDNDNYSYLLTVIDVLSKYAWVVPVKNKTSASIIEAFKQIFSKGRVPSKLQTDEGKEFLNKPFQTFLKERKVGFFTSYNQDIKASVVERFNRTLKEKLWRYFTKKNTLRYLEPLPRFVRAYNRSYHRSIKTAPAEVDSFNQEDVWQNLYGHPKKEKLRKLFKMGDRVRISKARRHFKKGYLPSWTDELFTVSRVNKTKPVTYFLKDDLGSELLGTFYQEEIQKVGDKDIFRVEAVLERRGNNFLVKWYGYPESFNSWIPKSAFRQYI